MKENYHPNEIEQSAQSFWQKNKSFKAIVKENETKFYCLSMFPYPSGNLHVGHMRNYTISDAIARYQRMQGKNVLHPMGWDAFGLPAENAAINNKCHPADWTYKNIETMKLMLNRMGFGYDWDREITTCKPEYYKWEQWFFTKLYEKKLAYKKLSAVNWCPHDKTVLANEQVENGRCWRCDTKVERKELSQWFIKITDYAEELLEDLDELTEWPEQVKTMQRNWIGKSVGLEASFVIEKNNINNLPSAINVFTTRADTIMGVTYIAIAAEHPIAKALAENNNEIKQFITEIVATGVSEAEIAKLDKKGIYTGISAIHPITKEKIPIWIANFVLMNYGCGAVMSVPAHDQRDFEFSKKYKLPIKQVITSDEKSIDISSRAFTETGKLINSGNFDGLTSDEASEAIINKLVKLHLGKKQVNYRLRDWGVSRQRYWGTPIPTCYLDNGETMTIEEQDLPVTLPKDLLPTESGSPLKTDKTWKNINYKNRQATRETDTFDTFMESSWYYARYCSANDHSQMLDQKQTKYWLPVDQYIGGIEHAVMHLLYTRFFHKLLRDIGLVSGKEPFKRLLCQGMVIADSYYKLNKNGAKIWIDPKLVDKTTLKIKETGEKVIYAGMSKMSKSKNNGVDPQDIVKNYGADALRLYIMFAAPIEQTIEWSESSLEGSYRFLRRFWSYAIDNIDKGKVVDLAINNLNEPQNELRRKIHETIKKVSDDFGRRLSFNTGIAAIMKLNNDLLKFECKNDQDIALAREAVITIIKLLYPVTPHITHYLWQKLTGNQNQDLLNSPWPVFDELAMQKTSVKYAIQVNGKLRANIEVSINADQDTIKNCALEDANVKKHTHAKEIKRIIVVPNKLINIVV